MIREHNKGTAAQSIALVPTDATESLMEEFCLSLIMT